MIVYLFIIYYREVFIYIDIKLMLMFLVLFFLNRVKDVGRFKVEVAAEFVNKRVLGCKVISYFIIKRFYN